MEKKIKDAIGYAMHFVGKPYKWGGETPMGGYDCSGFVQEILASIGIDPRGDQTAQGLYDHFQVHGTLSRERAGALAFYGSSKLFVKHIAFCLNDYQVIEAGGGGSTIHSIQDAIDGKAFVRVRPITYRRDYMHCLIPYY